MKTLKAFFVFGILSALPGVIHAEKIAQKTNETTSLGFVFWFTIIVCIFLILVGLYILYTLQVFINISNGKGKETVLETITKKLTAVVPVENEEEILFHHEYDGIRELDNSLPPWWLYMFYATIVFSFIYMGYYHIFKKGDLQTEEYNNEIKAAEIDKVTYLKNAANALDENSVTILTDKARIENGKSVFIQYCSACHGKIGEGGIGPNLTDPYWLHGGGIKNVFKTIKYGVTQKGMISWEKQLSPTDIQEAASYILSLKGSNPANGKAPQGDLYQEK